MLDEPSSDEQEFRSRAATALALATVLAAAPFGVVDLVLLDHPRSGVGTLALTAGIVVHAVLAARAPARTRISGPLLVPLCTAAILLSIQSHGVGALFWCYPAVLGYCCLLEERTAWTACAVTVAAALWLAWTRLPHDIVLRAAVTLLVVTAFAATVVRVIGAQSRRLRSRVETDSLTGLPNRRSLDAGLERASATVARGQALTLLALDVDRFKSVNDEHGHAAGDAVLRATGAFLGERTGPRDAVWRTGGEEFLLLLHGAGASDARTFAGALVREYREQVRRPDGPATFSVGIATAAPGEPVDDWLRRADRALYRAKAQGRDRAVAAPPPDPVPPRRTSGPDPVAQPSSAADSSGSSSNRSPTSP